LESILEPLAHQSDTVVTRPRNLTPWLAFQTLFILSSSDRNRHLYQKGYLAKIAHGEAGRYVKGLHRAEITGEVQRNTIEISFKFDDLPRITACSSNVQLV